MNSIRLLAVPVIATAFIFGFNTHAHAQEAGIKLTPATIEERAERGDQIVKTLTITNINNEEREYFLYKRNIKGVEPGGVPLFAEETAEPTGYEITDWIQLEEESITIPANGEVEYELIINVPGDASPGSHFGGIFISAEPPRLREIGAGVGYEVASIISIRIEGDIVDSVRVRSFSTDKLFYGKKDIGFLAKIENQGNILVRPRGPLSITSMFGGDPEIIIVNDSLAGVFPGTVRDFSFRWEDEGVGFGRYEAILALVYDGDGGQRTIDASVVFWIFPSKIVISLLVGIVSLILFGYIMTRLYIRRALSQAAGGRRVVAQRYRRHVGISRFAFVFVSLMGVFVLFLIMLLVFFA